MPCWGPHLQTTLFTVRTMTTKESMLQKIREAVGDLRNSVSLPPPPDVWMVEGLSVDEQANRFRANIEAVAGEVVFCNDLAEAVKRIAALLDETGSRRLAVHDREPCRTVAEQLEGKELTFAAAEASAESLSALDAGIVSPELLLSDTGSCVFSAPTPFDRLTTYITPLSIVVASRSMLREHLPQAWTELKPRLETAKTGEFVIVTGPSRTADIEKMLILGVHGPKRIVVFLMEKT